MTFKNCPNDVPKEVCSAVKRLHLNLGHPSERELLRLLAYQGAISKHMITAVKHLHCASCSRNKPPLKPRPSAMPVANMGQFNDTIQTDVFYCRDVVGGNHAILGIRLTSQLCCTKPAGSKTCLQTTPSTSSATPERSDLTLAPTMAFTSSSTLSATGYG